MRRLMQLIPCGQRHLYLLGCWRGRACPSPVRRITAVRCALRRHRALDVTSQESAAGMAAPVRRMACPCGPAWPRALACPCLALKTFAVRCVPRRRHACLGMGLAVRVDGTIGWRRLARWAHTLVGGPTRHGGRSGSTSLAWLLAPGTRAGGGARNCWMRSIAGSIAGSIVESIAESIAELPLPRSMSNGVEMRACRSGGARLLASRAADPTGTST